ncbi:unnamed protein product, partial [marine sediment metagenome]
RRVAEREAATLRSAERAREDARKRAAAKLAAAKAKVRAARKAKIKREAAAATRARDRQRADVAAAARAKIKREAAAAKRGRDVQLPIVKRQAAAKVTREIAAAGKVSDDFIVRETLKLARAKGTDDIRLATVRTRNENELKKGAGFQRAKAFITGSDLSKETKQDLIDLAIVTATFGTGVLVGKAIQKATPATKALIRNVRNALKAKPGAPKPVPVVTGQPAVAVARGRTVAIDPRTGRVVTVKEPPKPPTPPKRPPAVAERP